MSVDTKHPFYNEFRPDWDECRDSFRGERVVKQAGKKYLPELQSATEGEDFYEAYKKRAVFHPHMRRAVVASMGVLHQKKAKIELPPKLEYLRDRASMEVESLQQVLAKINAQQLIVGRVGLLVDLPDNDTTDNPYLAMYHAERAINWDEGRFGGIRKLTMAVLDESDYQRTAFSNFDWQWKKRYRVLMSDGSSYGFALYDEDGGLDFNLGDVTEFGRRGRKLEEIPLTFINYQDLDATPSDPPLMDVARLAMAIYRGEADYRLHLFMLAQGTLVTIGAGDEDEEWQTGAGAVMNLPHDANAKYIGIQGVGLSEQRQALENDKNKADRMTGELIHAEKVDRESGAALKARQASQAATLVHIALTGAAGMERALRQAAELMGANPDEVSVTPNMDFTTDTLDGDQLLKLITANQMGAPLSRKSIHRILVDRGLTEMQFEEEMRLVEEERAQEESLDGTDAGGDNADENEGDDA